MDEFLSILSYRRMLGRENTNFRKNLLANWHLPWASWKGVGRVLASRLLRWGATERWSSYGFDPLRTWTAEWPIQSSSLGCCQLCWLCLGWTFWSNPGWGARQSLPEGSWWARDEAGDRPAAAEGSPWRRRYRRLHWGGRPFRRCNCQFHWHRHPWQK